MGRRASTPLIKWRRLNETRYIIPQFACPAHSKCPRSSGRHHDDNILWGSTPHSTALVEHRVPCAERGNVPVTQEHILPCHSSCHHWICSPSQSFFYTKSQEKRIFMQQLERLWVEFMSPQITDRPSSYPWCGLLDKPESHEAAWGAKLSALWGEERVEALCPVMWGTAYPRANTVATVFISQLTLQPTVSTVSCPEASPSHSQWHCSGDYVAMKSINPFPHINVNDSQHCTHSWETHSSGCLEKHDR